jgi:hypothetical protein
MTLAGTVLFGPGTVLAKRQPLALPPATGAAWQVGMGSAVLLVLAETMGPRQIVARG